jgi:hypothetical protein
VYLVVYGAASPSEVCVSIVHTVDVVAGIIACISHLPHLNLNVPQSRGAHLKIVFGSGRGEALDPCGIGRQGKCLGSPENEENWRVAKPPDGFCWKVTVY